MRRKQRDVRRSLAEQCHGIYGPSFTPAGNFTGPVTTPPTSTKSQKEALSFEDARGIPL